MNMIIFRIPHHVRPALPSFLGVYMARLKRPGNENWLRCNRPDARPGAIGSSLDGCVISKALIIGLARRWACNVQGQNI